MGQKVHPIGFRLGVIRDADSRWFTDKKHYPELLLGDYEIRKFIKNRLGYGNISRIDIERAANKVRVTLFTARPGAVIGRGGRGIDDLTKNLQQMVSKRDKDARVHVNVSEVRQPELDAQLVAENVAQQLERMISHRRAMRQAVTRCLRMNGRGIKISVSGRLGGGEIARSETTKFGKVPLHTLRADIDYGFAEAATKAGRIGIKVWIYKGEILPEKAQAAEAAARKKAVEAAAARQAPEEDAAEKAAGAEGAESQEAPAESVTKSRARKTEAKETAETDKPPAQEVKPNVDA
ncbi:MAG: 30S ribosomal protein S3 [Armatimonadetes bacterium]|nr:30S ribosomal protein S3 [Armatimonadota bacterium]